MSVYFPLKAAGRVTREQILDGLLKTVKPEDVKCIQLTDTKCVITLNSAEAKGSICTNGVTVNNRYLSMSDVEKTVTNVTIKDAPAEMDDATISTALTRYGEVVSGSVKRGMMKGTGIETGTRYLQLVNVKNLIPTEVQAGRFTLRVYCDNNKTACRHCGDTSHPYYRCPAKPNLERRCFRCQATDHLKAECPNDIMCLHCGTNVIVLKSRIICELRSMAQGMQAANITKQ